MQRLIEEQIVEVISKVCGYPMRNVGGVLISLSWAVDDSQSIMYF